MLSTPVSADDFDIGAREHSSESRWITVGCLSAYGVLAVAAFLPASPWNDTRLPASPSRYFGLGDPAQMTWFLAWFPYAIQHGLSLFHTNIIDYPTGVNLASNTSVPLLGLLASPITLTLGPVAAFNVLLRLAFFSSAGSMFMVLRSWSRWPAAFVGGLLYGFGPYLVTHGQSHLNLAFVPIPPIIVWCLYDLVIAKRHSPTRMGLTIGVLAGAQALIEPELLSMLAIVVALGLVGFALYSFRSPQLLRDRFGRLVHAGALALVPFLIMTGYMIWWMLRGPGHVTGTVLRLANLQQYRADLLGPIFPTDQLFTPVTLAVKAFGYVGGNDTENSSYLGLAAVVLLVVFALRWRRNLVIVVSALLALVAFVLSLGSVLTIDGHATGIALVVGSDEFARVIAAPRPRTTMVRIGEVAGVATMVLAVVLMIPRVPFTTRSAPWPPETVSMLTAIPTGSVVLTYPFTISPNTQAMSWQAQSAMRFRLIGGYATVPGRGGIGQQYPVLLRPPFVQEYLSAAQGTTSWVPFYPPPSPRVDPGAALCRFMRTYHVDAFIFDHAGFHPDRVQRLLVGTLGHAQRSTKVGSVLLWLQPVRHCP